LFFRAIFSRVWEETFEFFFFSLSRFPFQPENSPSSRGADNKYYQTPLLTNLPAGAFKKGKGTLLLHEKINA
jgi:hypothetical protein